MRQVAADCSALGSTKIARTVCELIDWKRPTGHLKNHECRQLLERLANEGRLHLPLLRKVGPRGPRRIEWTPASDPQSEITGAAGDFAPLTLTLVEAGPRDSMVWYELVDRYHYLRYRMPVGAHLRYYVRSERLGETILACLQWSSPAWKMAAHDRWIGWNDQQRKSNLQRIVNHGRFLILPWVAAKGLASKILALSAWQMPARLGNAIWMSSPAAGNPCGRGPFSRNLLPGGQLDPYRANHGTRSHGPGANG